MWVAVVEIVLVLCTSIDRERRGSVLCVDGGVEGNISTYACMCVCAENM